MSDLLPCPFCGGDGDIDHDHTVEENHACGCHSCGVWFDTFNSDDAIAAWNTRAALDAMLAKAREDALRGAAEKVADLYGEYSDGVPYCDRDEAVAVIEALIPSVVGPASVQDAARVLLDVVERRAWSHYPIEMPLTINGNGPAKVGRDAHCMTYEVWESDTLRSISDHNKLPHAIEAWLRALAEGEA